MNGRVRLSRTSFKGALFETVFDSDALDRSFWHCVAVRFGCVVLVRFAVAFIFWIPCIWRELTIPLLRRQHSTNHTGLSYTEKLVHD